MKKTLLILLSIMMIFTIAACSNTETPVSSQEPQWSITVEGLEDVTELTDMDLEKLTFVDLEATLRTRDGSEDIQQWRGVPLKAVLEAWGVAEFQEIVVEAGDGYSQSYTPELAGREGTILGIEKNGEALDEEIGPVQLVPQGEPGNMWIKNVAKIKVVQ